MKDRISHIIKEKKVTKTEFAKRLGVSQAFVSQVCAGTSGISDRTITDICREFGVNEIWIRTGEGDPFQEESRNEQIMRFAAQTVKGSDEFRKAMVSMLAQLDAEDWENLAKIYQKVATQYKKGE
jgi:transcriptional regulator with XRE-family HTH domain